MSMSLVLALQAAAIPSSDAPAPQRWTMPSLAAGGAADFDLARQRLAAGGRCFGAGTDEVVVCGRRGAGAGDYPLAYWARMFAPRPIRAEMNLGGNVQGRIHAEAVPMDRGAVSNRVMVGIRWPF